MKKSVLMMISCLLVLGTFGCDFIASLKPTQSVLVRVLEQNYTGSWFVGNLQDPILTNTAGHIVLTRFLGPDFSEAINQEIVKVPESSTILDGQYTVSIFSPKGTIHLYGTAKKENELNVVHVNYFDVITDDAAHTLLTDLSIRME